MKKTLLLLIASATLLPAATFTGIITDSMCLKDHKAMNVNADDKCIRECVKNGDKFVLFDGKNAYKLSDQQTPGQFAAQRVKVTGTLYPKTGIIKVEKIEAMK